MAMMMSQKAMVQDQPVRKATKLQLLVQEANRNLYKKNFVDNKS